jgi:hypothetical protein
LPELGQKLDEQSVDPKRGALMTGSKIELSKLDAARPQLNGAIKLWFREADPVVAHAVISGAYHI